MFSRFVKAVVIHFISLTMAVIIWIYSYLNGINQYIIATKLNISIPQKYTIIGKNKDIFIRVVVQTNRKYEEYLKQNYEIYKKVNIKGKIFPKKVVIKIDESDIKLPHFLKIINIIDKNISITCDILKEVIFPVELSSVIYKGEKIQHYTISFEPDYILMKVPSSFSRITKHIYLDPLNIETLPLKPKTFKLPIPEQFYPYLKDKIKYINVTLSPKKIFKENVISIPVNLVILPQVIEPKIKSLKISPEKAKLIIQYPPTMSLYRVKKNIVCYVEIKKITLSLHTLPLICLVKNPVFQSKISIIDISPTSVKVKISRKIKQ